MQDTQKQSSNSIHPDSQRPFMGLRSYEEKNKAQFGGRDEEIKELYTLVSTSRLTIIFGKSGIGKTSLIKAGLIPELRKNYLLPIYLRVDYSSVKSPLIQVREFILDSLRIHDKTVPEIGELTLWEYFSNLKLLDGLVTPVLVFDQFEEIFTLGKDKSKELQEFIIELSDLAENRVPVIVQERRKKGIGAETPRYEDQNFHMVISLREDYLANLESLNRYMPSMKNSRFRALQMTAMQAMEAVMKPAADLIDRDVASAIIRKLPGVTEMDLESTMDEDLKRKFVVEPFLLSLICFEINEKRIEEGLEKITADLVAKFEIGDVINLYYTKTMRDFGENVQLGIENTLLTESGFRKLQSIEDLYKNYSIREDDINRLVERRIVRKELRDGVNYIELIHDVLAPVIKKRRDDRVNKLRENEKAEAVRRVLKAERDKIKRIVGYALLIIVPTITLLFVLKLMEVRRLERLELANNLLRTSNIISSAYGDWPTGAQVARIAYLINKENNGDNEIDFYDAMLKCLDPLGDSSLAAKADNSVRSLVGKSSDTIYYGGNDGVICRKILLDGRVDTLLRLRYDDPIKNRITSLAISQNKKFLAAAGTFDSVYLFDLSKGQSIPVGLPTGDSLNGKSIAFMANDKLLVRVNEGIIAWEMSAFQKVSWTQKVMVAVDDQKHRQVIKLDPAEEKFFKSIHHEFYCMTATADRIAIGTDSAIIIVTKDTVFEIKSTRFDKITSIEFGPSGTNLITGSKFGALCQLSLSDFSMEFKQFQNDDINEISFSGNRKYMASASNDGSVAIWKLDSNRNLLSPPLLIPNPLNCENKVYSILFNKHDDFLLAAYQDGSIINRPVHAEILADKICQINVIGNLDSSIRFYLNRLLIDEKKDSDIIFKKLCNFGHGTK